jgi:hypothetical protein
MGAMDRPDGSVRISWTADGYQHIDVYGRWRTRAELDSFARDVADAALFNRNLEDLRKSLQRTRPGEFDLVPYPHDRVAPRVVVRLHPPPGEPNPDFD